MTRALVVGGGVAGLAAAIDLAVAGREVTLLERESEVGGKAGSFSQDGFRFDTGPSVFTLPEVLRGLFRDAGRTLPLALTPLDLLCRYRFAGGRVWDVHHDVETTVASLDRSEAEAYRALLAEAEALYRASAPTFVFGDAPGPLDLLSYGLRHGLGAHPLWTLPQLLRARGAEGDLATFFLRFATYFGADPYRAPAVLHNIAWVELGLGVYHPEGGLHGVVAALRALALELGVELRGGEGATAFERSGRRVQAVVTDRGRYRVDEVVSAIDVVHTAALLGRRHPNARREASLSGLVLLLGVEGETPELAEHTILFPSDYPSEFADIGSGRFPEEPTLYLHLSCRREPDDAPDGHENWFVMSNAPAGPGDVAAELAHAERMVAQLVRRGLLDRARIRVRRSLGPRALARFGHLGSLYGRAPHSLTATLRPGHALRGVDNLALAGGTVHPGGGVPLALLSGRAAARSLLGRR